MSQPMTSDEIREAFLEFFHEVGHEIVPSAPLPQYDNPTLLFTNAGMNQFVDLFLGKEKRPYSRAASSQKCMRVQGKHNDLENVGPSPWHHTFFEMLGNFSFGDYFKESAIRFAYDFLTVVCGLPVDRLWYTVHTSDDHAFNIWVNQIGVDPERVLRMGDKTNFWMMGDVGPCGPTSEIHWDWGPEACTCSQPDCSVLLDNECGRWLEVWNLVFMQFNQAEDGTRSPLPKPGVDTGMGLERITSAVQHTPVNYDNDLFLPAMNRVQALLGDSDEERAEKYVGYRVIADHGRAATFMIADGVMPGNVGAGYVLRMVIRRAARYGHKIGFTQPFLAEVAQIYIEQMGQAYPELRQRRDHVLHTLRQEEERFARTLERALAYLDNLMSDLHRRGERIIPGEDAFNLHATHGLALEITRDVAKEHGFIVDEASYEEAKEAHALASGAGAFAGYQTGTSVYGDLLEMLVRNGRLSPEGVDYDPYSGTEMESEIVGIVQAGDQVNGLQAGDKAEVVTAATPFYVESGGEVSDTGVITIEASGCLFRVDDVIRPKNVPGLILYVGEMVSGEMRVGQVAQLQVDKVRRSDIRRNHTATHILHRELRAHLGNHVTQAGSLVAPDRLRFDFSHGSAVDKQTLSIIEQAINDTILANFPVHVAYMGKNEAIGRGAMALFGEKYGNVVRTICIDESCDHDPYSFELCGGLHVRDTGEIGLFRFISEGAVSAGVRRVEAVTGRASQALVAERLDTLERVAYKLNVPLLEVEPRLESLISENRILQKELERLQRQLAKGQFDELLAQMQNVKGVNVLAAQVAVPDVNGLREMADWFRDKVRSGTAVLATVSNDKPIIIAVVTEDVIERGVKAGDLVREVAQMVGGGGGGRPELAQAGGKDASKLAAALAAVPGLVEKALK